jgi:hypothetical protein
MRKENGELTKLWSNAKPMVDNFTIDKKDELLNLLELGILHLAKLNLEKGITDDKAIIEGVKKEVWHSRFWVAIENCIWPTYPDYEQNWKVD